MKNIFNFLIIFTLGLGLTSCQNKTDTSGLVKFYKDSSALYNDVAKNNKSVIKPKKIEFKAIHDSQLNMSACFMPIPSDWEINNNITKKNNALITGPNGLKILPDMTFNFVYSSDPYINQSMQQNGYIIAPLKSIEEVIKQDFETHANAQGVTLLKTYRVQELIDFDNYFDQFLFKSVPQHNKVYDVMVSEWTDNKGKSSLIVFHYNKNTNQYQQVSWNYYIQTMETNTSDFEKAKKEYLYALSNIKYNPQWLRANYIKQAEISKKLGEIHQSNMAEIKAFGDAMIKKGNEYSKMVDRNHEKFMDTQLERTNVSTDSGDTFKVDAGSKYYWVNSNGQYISSDNPYYNPNDDPTYKNTNWKSTTINN